MGCADWLNSSAIAYDGCMKVQTTIIALSSILFAHTAALGQEFELKGLRLGAPMTECPQGARQSSKPGARQTMCSLGPTTLANQEVTDHVVVFADGAVIGVMFQLTGRGFNANREVRDALIEKFGAPSSRSKPHVNDYVWDRSGMTLALDGYKGNVLMLDMEANRRIRAEESKTNKNDL